MMKSVALQWKYIGVLLASLSPGFILFDPWLVLIQLLLGFFSGIFVFRRDHGDLYRVKHFPSSSLFLFVMGLLYFLFRAIPFFMAQHPLGYDSGIYRYEIWSSLQALPEFVSGLFVGLPLLTNVFGVFAVPLDFLLYGGFLLSSMLLFYSVVQFVFDRFGKAESI